MSFLETKTPELKKYLSEKANDLSSEDFKNLKDLYELYESYFTVNATEDNETTIRALHFETSKTLSRLDHNSPAFRFVDDRLFTPLNDLLISIIDDPNRRLTK